VKVDSSISTKEKEKERKMLRPRSNRTVLAIAALLLVVTSAFAQMPEMKPERAEGESHCKGRGEHMMMIPDLTEQQHEQMKSMRTEHMKEMQSLRNQMAEKKARLRTLSTADKVKMAEINKVIEDMGEMRTQMMKMREQHRQDIRKMLTDDQRIFFDTHQPMHQKGPHHKAMPHMR
jgi:Spy/CpxP family protein refolding chaperone